MRPTHLSPQVLEAKALDQYDYFIHILTVMRGSVGCSKLIWQLYVDKGS
jgi:hypothetical protein